MFEEKPHLSTLLIMVKQMHNIWKILPKLTVIQYNSYLIYITQS